MSLHQKADVKPRRGVVIAKPRVEAAQQLEPWVRVEEQKALKGRRRLSSQLQPMPPCQGWFQNIHNTLVSTEIDSNAEGVKSQSPGWVALFCDPTLGGLDILISTLKGLRRHTTPSGLILPPDSPKVGGKKRRQPWALGPCPVGAGAGDAFSNGDCSFSFTVS
jgi:hypothetical protein